MRKIIDFLIKNIHSLTFAFLLLLSITQIIDKNYYHSSKFNFFSNSLVNIINEEKISELDDQEIIKQLSSIKGVGRWTAEMFLIFTLRRTDVFPVTDLGVQKGFQIFYSLDNLPTIEMMNQKSESWRPYRTIMSLYLWYAVEGPFEW